MKDPDIPSRRVIRVCCSLCGVFIRKMVTDCIRVTETRRTCVFRETGGRYLNAPAADIGGESHVVGLG